MAERTVRVVLSGDATSLVNAANSARTSLNQLARVNTGAPAAGLRQTGAAAQSAEKDSASLFDKFKSSVAGQVSAANIMTQVVSAAFGSIGGAIGSVLDAGMQYQDTLLNMGAITSTQMQVAGASMTDVAAKARSLGKDIEIPGASATDAAIAMTELAKGGFSVADSMTAAKGTLQLAAAASIDAGKAAEIQVNVMNAFQLSADQAGHVADVLTNVANQASGDITDFAYALTAVGSTAHSFNISLEDTNTVLGLFANAGIKGEEGGTLMKTMLVRLAAASGPAAGALETLGVTAYDASGNFEGMDKVTQQLSVAHQHLTTEAFNSATAIAFGTRGIKGAAILAVQGADGFQKMGDAMLITNSAADIAKAKMSGLSGSFENFLNQVQDLQLTVFSTFAPQLTDMVNTFAGAFPAMVDAAMGAIGDVGSKAGEFLGPIVDGVKSLATEVAPYVMEFGTSVKEGITTALDALAPFGQKLADLFSTAQSSGVIDTLGTALTTVGHAFVGVTDALGPVLSLIGGAVGIFADLPGPIQAVTFAFGAAILLKGPLNALFLQAIAGYTRMGLAATAGAAEVRTAGGVINAAQARIALGAKAMWAAMGGWVTIGVTALITALGFIATGSDDAASSTADFSAAIDENTGKLSENAAKVLATAAEASGGAAKYQAIGGAVSDYVDALGGVPGAQDKVNTTIAAAQKAAADAALALNAAGSAAAGVGYQAGGASPAIAEQAGALTAAKDAASQFTADQAGLGAEADKTKLILAGSTGELGKLAGSADGAGGSVSALTQAQQAFIDSSAAGVDPIKSMNDALKDMKTAASDADTAGQFLWATLEQLSGGTITAEQAARLEAAAFRDIGGAARDLADAQAKVTEKQQALTDATNQYGADSPQAAAAARDLATANDAVSAASDKQFDATVKAAQAGLDAAGAAYAHKAAMGDLAGATADASAATQTARDQFIKAQTDLGMDATAAGLLADQYHLIPADVVTNLQANGIDAAQAKVDALNKALTTLGTTSWHFSVSQTGETIATTSGGSKIGLDAQGRVLVDFSRGHAAGGWISGPGGPRDDQVHARVSPGEFVVNAAQAQKHAGLLEAINAGVMGFADGGPVPDATTGAAAGIAVAGAVAAPDVGVIEAAWAAISTAVQTAWVAVIQPVLDALALATGRTATDWVALQTVTAEPVWSAIGAVVSDTVNATLLPNYAALDLGTQTVGAEMVTLLNGSVIPVWTQTGASVANTWAGTIAPNYGALNAGSAGVGQAMWDLLNTAVIPAWSQIGSTITGTYTGSIVPAWTGVQGFAAATGGFFTGVASGVSTATGQVTGDIAKITAAIDEFFKMVDGKAPATSTPTVSATIGGGLQVLADGGPITAGTGPRSDDVLIRASKGEFVVNAAATAQHLPELTAINNGGAFADGGLVGDKISGPIQQAITTGVQKAITAGVERVVAAMTPAIPGFTGPVPAGARGAFLQAVLSKQGTAYVWGAAGPDVFDCSGLMSWGLDQAGVSRGRLTAAEFGDDFPRANPEKPGDMAIFDTGRVSPKAGHIGAVLDPAAGSMMHTDGAGPARISPYRGRSGLMGFIDAIGGSYSPTPSATSKQGDPPAANWLQAMLDRIKSGGAAVSAAYNPSGGVAQWHATVLQALGLTGQPAGYASYVEHQMDTESSGNPRAINNTDANAQRGDPSRGLMQTIMSTFNAFRLPNLSADIYDPLSNIVASIRYVLATYKSIPAGMRGVAYENGGPIPTGFSMAYNGTGQTEMGLTNSQWATANQAINHVSNMSAQSQAPQVITVNYFVDGTAFDGRAEVIVDGKLTQLGQTIDRMLVQTA